MIDTGFDRVKKFLKINFATTDAICRTNLQAIHFVRERFLLATHTHSSVTQHSLLHTAASTSFFFFFSRWKEPWHQRPTNSKTLIISHSRRLERLVGPGKLFPRLYWPDCFHRLQKSRLISNTFHLAGNISKCQMGFSVVTL